MGRPMLSAFLAFFLAFFLMSSTVLVEGDHHQSPLRKTYIVHVKKPESTVLDSSVDVEAWYKSFLTAATASASDSADIDTRLVYMYHHVASAFAARLTEDEVAEMSKKEGFLHAYASRAYSPLTTHTPSFLGLNLPMGVWNRSNMGEGIIVGVLDTGVTPNHPSFSGDGMPPPPSKWKGWCELPASACNNKLIGARFFLDAAIAEGDNATRSPADEFGHGTHTASTAAGAAVADAQALGNAGGVASGMAPYAHLAIYRVCGANYCMSADILAGLDAAVSDGVDVVSISLGGDAVPFSEDTIAVGGFRAAEKGVFVSCAAGNSGPTASSLCNEAPWLLTVAASTTDRSILAMVRLGNGQEFEGQSLFQPKTFPATPFPLVDAGASGKPDAAFCGNGSLDGVSVEGKVVLCEIGGDFSRIEKGENVKRAGGVGMILMNEAEQGFSTSADAHVIPASRVSYVAGLSIKKYINSTTDPKAAIVFKGTVFATSPSPAIISFSSRGPSITSPGILKPDITGPGVSILAAWPFPLESYPSNSALTFNVISGTSMSTPHLSGIAALIKRAHPDWSPAAIKSAIMTTAEVLDRKGMPIVEEQHRPADLYAIGAGHVNPRRATDPGLVYDLQAKDYVAYLCGLGYNTTQLKIITGHPVDCSGVKIVTGGELNYPSISVSFESGVDCVTVERTVKNVGEANSKYWAEIDAPMDVSVTVEPKMLKFCKVNEEITFKVIFSTSANKWKGSVSQGHLKWVSKNRIVRSPISVTFN